MMNEKKIIKVKNFKSLLQYHEKVIQDINNTTVNHKTEIKRPTPVKKMPTQIQESLPPKKMLDKTESITKNSAPKKLFKKEASSMGSMPPKKPVPLPPIHTNHNNEQVQISNSNKPVPKKLDMSRLQNVSAPKVFSKEQLPVKKMALNSDLKQKLEGRFSGNNPSIQKEPIRVNPLDPNRGKNLGLFSQNNNTNSPQPTLESYINTEFVIEIEYKSCTFFKMTIPNMEWEPSFHIFENMNEDIQNALLQAETNLIDINGKLYFVNFQDEDFYLIKNHDMKKYQEMYQTLRELCGTEPMMIDDKELIQQLNDLITDHISLVIEQFEIQLKDLILHNQDQQNFNF